jgi:hypothetical protein
MATHHPHPLRTLTCATAYGYDIMHRNVAVLHIPLLAGRTAMLLSAVSYAAVLSPLRTPSRSVIPCMGASEGTYVQRMYYAANPAVLSEAEGTYMQRLYAACSDLSEETPPPPPVPPPVPPPASPAPPASAMSTEEEALIAAQGDLVRAAKAAVKAGVAMPLGDVTTVDEQIAVLLQLKSDAPSAAAPAAPAPPAAAAAAAAETTVADADADHRAELCERRKVVCQTLAVRARWAAREARAVRRFNEAVGV